MGCNSSSLKGQPDSSTNDPEPDETIDSHADPRPDTPPDMELEVELPDVDEDAPVAALVGPPIALDDGTHGGGQPAVAWNGSGWGVAWGEWSGVVFRSIDADANPVGPLVDIDLGVGGVYVVSLEWKDGEYAFCYSGTAHLGRMGIIDEWGSLLHGPVTINVRPFSSEEPDLTWSDDAEGWVVGYSSGEYEDSRIWATLLDEEASIVGSSLEVGASHDMNGPRVVALKSRLSMVWPTRDGIRYRSFRWADILSSPDASTIHSSSSPEDVAIEAEGFFDYTIVVVIDGTDVLAIVVEPLWGSVVSGPHVIGHSGITGGRPGIAVAQDRGYLGVCHETGPGGEHEEGDDGVDFRLVAPDGTPLGAELVVASDLENIGDCAVGWSGSEFVVIYWSCGGDEVWNTIYAQRVRPLI